MQKNIFDILEMPNSFIQDISKVKKNYFRLSKKYHPDFYTNASKEEKLNAEKKITDINQALVILTDLDKIIEYVLKDMGLLDKKDKMEMFPDFLMQTMELNEEIQEVQIEGNKEKLDNLKIKIADMQKKLFETIKENLKDYNTTIQDPEKLEKVKEYYLKNKYFRRLKNNLK